MDDTKNFWHLFKRRRNSGQSAAETEKEQALKAQIDRMACNGITFDFDKERVSPRQSKFGGLPALPPDWEWPRYTDEYGKEKALPFLLQLNCEELAPYDTDNRLPHEGMFYLFYDLTNQPWRNSEGARLLYTPVPESQLVPVDYPDQPDKHPQIFEMGLKFSNHPSAPDWDDYSMLTGGDENTHSYTDWDLIEKRLGNWGYRRIESAGQVLGYASLIQNGIAEVCESRARGDKQDSYTTESAREWTLLLQLNCVEEPEVNIPFGDCGSLYFYIRRSDLERRDFSHIQFELQCY